MPACALSEQAKRARRQADYDLRMAVALDTYCNEQLKLKGQSVRNVAACFNVAKSTLYRLSRGGHSMTAFNLLKCKLSQEEEGMLLDLAEKLADRGLPLGHEGLRAAAFQLLVTRVGEDKAILGKNWVDNFLVRHNRRLSTHWSRPLDSACACALNLDVVNHWFELLKKHLVPEDGEPILPENIYNMDESGFPPQDTLCKRVIGCRGVQSQHCTAAANRENVMVIITICADGTVIRPRVIFKGQNIMQA